jgi:APA family basic amino acid/polyamine antiporter
MFSEEVINVRNFVVLYPNYFVVFLEKKPNADRPYKAFGYPLYALYIVVTVAFLLIYDTFNTGLGLCIVALGIPVYYFVMNKKEQN